MADPRFFKKGPPLTIREIVHITGATVRGNLDSSTLIKDVAPLEYAGPGDISFLENRRYANVISSSQATACFLTEDLVSRAPPGMGTLITQYPRRSYAKVSRTFYQNTKKSGNISQTAQISETAVLGPECRVDNGAVLGGFCQIGKNCWIGANTVIDDGCVIGEDTKIGSNVSISHSQIGSGCFIFPGVKIGQPGFGFEIDSSGPIEMPQLGRVIIGDNVEIGANSTVDRGAGPDTIIGPGTRIDNLVQIGHNVEIGKGCIIVAQVGISGSTKIGDHTVIGGQVGLAGHLNIGSNVKIAAQSGVTRNIEDGAIVGGAPAVPIKQFRRQVASIKSLGRRNTEA
tara:strand:- start:650 stop:1675 length:1026 start_codon:yes stop_codon:yes gene_type:complete